VNKLLAIVVLILAASSAAAQSLKADAILCEIEAPLALLSEPNLSGQPASVVIKRVSATVEFYEIKAKFHQSMGNLATQERDIHKDTRYPNRGATSSRMDEARAGQQDSDAERKRYAEFMARCTATPNTEQSATVLESRPISKLARVRTQFGGREHDLWTHEYYLK
jgi:hypothetical protein